MHLCFLSHFLPWCSDLDHFYWNLSYNLLLVITCVTPNARIYTELRLQHLKNDKFPFLVVSALYLCILLHQWVKRNIFRYLPINESQQYLRGEEGFNFSIFLSSNRTVPRIPNCSIIQINNNDNFNRYHCMICAFNTIKNTIIIKNWGLRAWCDKQ